MKHISVVMEEEKRFHPAKAEIRKKLSKRLAYSKMMTSRYSALGLVNELRQIRKNQIAIMEWLLA